MRTHFDAALVASPPPSEPRVLVLAPRYPYPTLGGDRLRIHNLCAALAARGYRLTLLALSDKPPTEVVDDPPAGIFEHVERVFLPKWQSWFNCVKALPTGTPLQLAYYWSEEFKERVEALAPEHDAILCHLIRSAEYALPFDIPRMLEMTDAISLNYKRVRECTGSLEFRRLVFGLEQPRLEAFERQIVDAFDAAVLVSGRDRDFLFGEDDERAQKVMVCSNGVDLTTLPYQFAAEGSNRIAFIGNMGTLQNLDAVEWFSQLVLPKIRRACPSATLEVVGHGANERLRRRLAALPGVVVIGGVPSISRAVAGAAVGVCPLRLGAGVQNKLLEYMALGLPSVTTPVGLEGLDAVAGEHLLVAESAEETAAAVLRLLDDRMLARRIATAARDFVERHHLWSAQLEPLVDRLGALIEEAAASQQVSAGVLRGRALSATRAQDPARRH